MVSRHTTGLNGAANASVFYAFDERGNVAQRLDAGGNILSTDLYDGFGARTGTALPGTGSSGDPWGFGAQWGYQSDAETGLVLCTNRYYDPQQGRFLTRDPAGYNGGMNLYGYTENDPVNEIDPDGTDGRNDGKTHLYFGPSGGYGWLRVYHNGVLLKTFRAANVTKDPDGDRNEFGEAPAPPGHYRLGPTVIMHKTRLPAIFIHIPSRGGIRLHDGGTGKWHPTEGCIRVTHNAFN